MSYAPYNSTTPDRREYFVQTTDATVTTLDQINIPTGAVYTIKAFVSARRTGGASGTAGDSAGYELMGTYKNIAGTVYIVGSLDAKENEDQAAWDATLTISGTNILIRVTGAADNNVTWSSSTTVVKAI